MWENGSRVPGVRHLEELARLYSVSSAFLLGKEEASENVSEREVLLRGIASNPNIHMEFNKWYDFLDEWAELISDIDTTPGDFKGKPPKQLDQGPDYTDSRKSATLAAQVREHYGLGTSPISDLYSFLDEHGVLVYKANLGDWQSTSNGVSGAFHNHPRLGFCIVVNAETSLGRQYFTLAHEFAHALFHYNAKSIISRHEDKSPREYFANSFATHFLVPTKELNRVIDQQNWRDKLDPYKCIDLAYSFHVSYAFMLYRLRNEKHISEHQLDDFRKQSPSALARKLNIDSDVFNKPGALVLKLDRYPPSVLQIVRDLINDDELSVSQAADLLSVSQANIQAFLKDSTEPTEAEQRELAEFAF